MPQGGDSQDEARKARLAAALRENLRRRKAQSRARSGQDHVGAASEVGPGPAADVAAEATVTETAPRGR